MMYTLLLITTFQDAVRQVLKDDRLNYTYRDDDYVRRPMYQIETRLRILEAYSRYRMECLHSGTVAFRYNRLR